MSKVFDCMVLGTGGMGSAALYYAAKKGWRVLGLDRFPPGHDRGSSHGQTRIIRQAYFEHSDYVPMAMDAYQLWAALEQESERKLFEPTGLLQIGAPEGPIISGIRESAVRHELPLREYDTNQLREAFPLFNCRDGDVGLYEEVAGFLRVEDCVETFADLAKSHGAELMNDVSVTGWSDGSAGFEVATSDGVLRCHRLIITAGAWASVLLPDMIPDLRVIAKHQHWFQIADDRVSLAEGCPTFFFERDNGYFYGFPSLGDRGAKIAEHSGGVEVPDPLSVNRDLDIEDLSRVQDFVHSCFNSPRAIHKAHSVCMYTMSPDEHFIVDRAGPSLVFACGLSGHGFKFAPVIGQALVNLLDGSERDDMAFLRCNRFNDELERNSG